MNSNEEKNDIKRDINEKKNISDLKINLEDIDLSKKEYIKIDKNK
jgi:hypothetical protein